MALSIVDGCANCYACASVCPNDAIAKSAQAFVIEVDFCTECADIYREPQCAAICPVEGVIVDEDGAPLNPPGSLNGRVIAASVGLGAGINSP